MTPAIQQLKRSKRPFRILQYHHDSNNASYGMEAVEKLQLNQLQVFKTLLVEMDKHKLVVALLPVCRQLNLKALAKLTGSKKAQLAEPQQVINSSGYILGGVSPLGQKKTLPTWIDKSAADYNEIFVSGGRRGLEIGIAPSDLMQLTRGQYGSL